MAQHTAEKIQKFYNYIDKIQTYYNYGAAHFRKNTKL